MIFIYISEVCKSIFAWNTAQYVEAEQNKYYERKKGRNYISRQACFMNRFTPQGSQQVCFVYFAKCDFCKFFLFMSNIVFIREMEVGNSEIPVTIANEMPVENEIVTIL